MTLLALAGVALAQDLVIPYEKYELDNGLDVILAPDASVPIVQVNVWYGVGSRDEVEGRTGFAHLFEHLMFNGSQNWPGEYFEPLQEVGARINGTTNVDRTNYFEQVPSEYLPLALWLESDRMGFLLPVLDETKLANQQEVVKNERRQRYENRPYGTSWITMLENVFPAGHPYAHATIGRAEDIDAAQLADVSAFFEQWYVPSNASLVICGDFDSDEAKVLVEQYFGDLPTVPQPVRPDVPSVTMAEEVVIRQIEQGAPDQKVWLAWPTPALYDQGDAALDVVSSVLSGGKDARLDKVLVHELQIAQDVQASQASFAEGSMYIIQATAAAGHTTDELVVEIDRIVAELATEGPTDQELTDALVNYEAGFIRRMSAVSAKANQLNSYNLFVGDPGYVQQDLDRYLGLSVADVQGAVGTWLPGDKRLQLHIHPEPVTQVAE
jgi:zinc protease